jgi:hypothetical protein
MENAVVILIAPLWPAQYWWPTVVNLSTRMIRLGKSEEVLEMGSRMKKRGLKLPPGEIGCFLLNQRMKEIDYSGAP